MSPLSSDAAVHGRNVVIKLRDVQRTDNGLICASALACAT
jgi:hypothetical protein